MVGPAHPLLAIAAKPAPGKSRSSATASRVEAQASQTGMAAVDKIFWVFVRRFWGAWKQSLLLVSPETVVRWVSPVLEVDLQVETASGKAAAAEGGQGFDLSNGGRESDVGAPRIHGELIMLGFTVSERTISRWMKRAPRDPQPGKAVGQFSSQSSRSHCRHGLLHRAHGHLSRPLRFLRHRPRWPAYPTFQCLRNTSS